MRFKQHLKREAEVAFSKRSQPAWFRVVKYVLVSLVLYIFCGTVTLWIILLTLFGISLVLHFWYRYKTEGWTKSYGLWKHDKTDIDTSERKNGL